MVFSEWCFQINPHLSNDIEVKKLLSFFFDFCFLHFFFIYVFGETIVIHDRFKLLQSDDAQKYINKKFVEEAELRSVGGNKKQYTKSVENFAFKSLPSVSDFFLFSAVFFNSLDSFKAALFCSSLTLSPSLLFEVLQVDQSFEICPKTVNFLLLIEFLSI